MHTLLPRKKSQNLESLPVRYDRSTAKRKDCSESMIYYLLHLMLFCPFICLAGEIHSDWRQVIAAGIAEKNLPVSLSSPNTCHEDSDDCGAIILGMEEKRSNWDKIGASMNSVRTKTLIQDADIVVVRFGEKYRQWNAAFDAGYAAALGKSIITLHPPSIGHMLKEVNSAAQVVCEDATHVVDSLAYVIEGILPPPRNGDKFVPIADRLGAGNPNP